MNKVAVVGIVEGGGKILLGKKTNIEHILSGAWHIPGGKVEDGESEEQAIKREIKEEAGIEIKVIKFFDGTSDATKNTNIRWYLCQALTHNLKPGDDLAEVKFVHKRKVRVSCGARATDLWPPKVKEYFK